ncbi:uncharacterized protein B0I36DRAFT_327399 [Microdochium trichocladiopsis]|uniref:Uncharacterized protein n=1 Tax=Microdochium trichocladiopsis TaxID=1682393 RepID=A0A9P9BNC1_9PEZI|nr:uncharacterized protein B0I36DRAFT_327399 [Microdochium trichocladiopsis]KAH7027578.1 hypothetical protein B0I36DRAFT_327399 [Microdochium trichocladiopsis]
MPCSPSVLPNCTSGCGASCFSHCFFGVKLVDMSRTRSGTRNFGSVSSWTFVEDPTSLDRTQADPLWHKDTTGVPLRLAQYLQQWLQEHGVDVDDRRMIWNPRYRDFLVIDEEALRSLANLAAFLPSLRSPEPGESEDRNRFRHMRDIGTPPAFAWLLDSRQLLLNCGSPATTLIHANGSVYFDKTTGTFSSQEYQDLYSQGLSSWDPLRSPSEARMKLEVKHFQDAWFQRKGQDERHPGGGFSCREERLNSDVYWFDERRL